MKLDMLRVVLGKDATVSVLRVDGEHSCFILEDHVRPPEEAKVPGFTAIPRGDYEVKLTHSPRYGVVMPLLMDVPGFTGIRIHPGNTPDDTEGCLLPGLSASALTVQHSRAAYQSLLAQLQMATARGESISIAIREV